MTITVQLHPGTEAFDVCLLVFGGPGIPVLRDLSVTVQENSEQVCRNLTTKIICQNDEANDTVEGPIQDARRRISGQGVAGYYAHMEDLRSWMTDEEICANDITLMKGSSIWLTTLPLAEEGYVLSKREFFNAIHLRYRWQLKRLPSHCAC